MWASRFYGMDVPADVELHEELTDRTVVDLVDAHLVINQSYFGAIDKTLSGFVILDDEDDDYTLWDLRDTQQVYRQDHETRDVELRHDSLAGYVAQAETKGPRESRRRIATAELCSRYQWLVWFFARPLTQDGVAVQTTDSLVRNAISRFRVAWTAREVVQRAFEREATALSDDPHLAIYWLLHAVATCDDELRARVVGAIGKGGPELVQVFVARLGRIAASGDVASVPDFRARRALALTYGAFELSQDELAPACLRALEVSPHTNSLIHALQVAAAMDRVDVAPVLARILDTTPGIALLRAMMDKRAGATSSRHADTLARLLVETGEPWYYALEALWLVHELSYEGPALVAATRRLVARDRYHRRALQMAMRAAAIAGQPVDALERDIAIADQISQPFQRVAAAPGEWEQVVAGLSPFTRTPFAYRVLDRTELNKPPPGLALWAARQIVRGNEPLIGEAFARLDDATLQAVLADTTPDDAALLLAILDAPEPGTHDTVARLAADRARAAILDQLALRLHEPAIFTKLMTILERPACAGLTALVWGRLGDFLPSLDDKQAVRVARCLIAHVLRHPHPAARAAAAQALFRFTHRGAEVFLADALTEYGVRHAAAKAADDPSAIVVDNLYAALAALATPGARRALAERLFAERRAYWRLGRALADVWDAALHGDVLALLRERRDPRAAGAYAFALRDFVKQREPIAELAAVIADWQGDTEVARGFLHYALVVGIDAALALGQHDVVRRAHEAAAWIAEPPLDPDHHARGTGWTNPLDAPDVAAALLRVLAPEPPAAVEAAARAKPAAQKAKAAAKPKAAPKAKPTAAAKAKVNAKAAAKPKAAPKAKPKAPPKAKPTAAAKAKAKPTTAAKAKAKPKTTPKAKAKSTAAEKLKAKPKTAAMAKAKAKPKTAAKATPRPKAKPKDAAKRR